MAAPPTIFARVTPKTIKVTEQYNYEAEPLKQTVAFPSRAAIKAPKGQIEVTIPYDGEKYFRREEFQALQYRQASIRQQTTTVLIGYLGFENYDATNLRDGLRLRVEHDTIALELPLRHPDLPAPPHLFGGRHACRFSHSYQPERLTAGLIHLHFQMHDEDDLSNLCNEIESWFLNEESGSLLTSKQLKLANLNLLREFHSFERSLTLELQLTLTLPSAIKVASERTPAIERVAIQWPVSLSNERLKLMLVQEGRCLPVEGVLYDPEQRAIVWGSPPLQRQASGQDSVKFSSPPMRLAIDQPGELYGKEALQGSVQFKLAGLLSGLQLQYFDATGHSQPLDMVYETTINVDFQVDLADVAAAKSHTPYHYLHFDGVRLDESRVADVRTVLADLGFRVRTANYNEGVPVPARFLVVGYQRQGQHDLWIWILLEGQPSQTQRQRAVSGSQSYITLIETGNLLVRMRGKGNGDYAPLVQLMNEAQAKLTRLFQNIIVAA